MKLIYAQGFNKNERLDFKPVIFNNIVQSFKTISEAMAEMGFEYDSPDNEVSIFASWCGAQAYYYDMHMRSFTSLFLCYVVHGCKM